MDLKQINSIKRIRDLKPITPLRPITPVRPITPLTLDNTYFNKVRVINYKPKTADSFADVLLGNWEGTLQLRNLLDEYDLGGLKDVPLVNKLVGSLLLVDKQFIKPVRVNKLDGFKDVGLNTLINASETLDVFANLVKSQFSGAGGSPGIDSLEDALGVGDTKERKVYNWNTGTFVGDLLLEIISDPLNWASFGITAVKDVAGTAVMKGTKEIVESTIRSNMDNAALKLSGVISESTLQDLTTVASKKTAQKLLINDTTPLNYMLDVRPALKKSTILEIDDVAKQLTNVSVYDDLDDSLSKALDLSAKAQSKQLRQYRAALQFKNNFKAYVEDPITTLGYANILVPYKVLQKIPLEDIFASLHNDIIKKYDKYAQASVYNPSFKTNVFVDMLLTKTDAMFSDQFKVLKKELKTLNISFRKLQYDLLAFFKENKIILDTKNPRIPNKTRLKFITWLSKRADYKELFKDKAVITSFKELFLKAAKENTTDVIDLFALGPAILQYSEESITASKNAIRLQRTLDNYSKNKFNPVTYKKGKRAGKLIYDNAGVPKATVKEDVTILDKFRYLNKTILRSGSGKEYGLAKLPDFIKDCMFTRNAEEAIPLKQKAIIAQILSDLGVTKTNYILIADVLSNEQLTNATKIKRIYKIVKSTAKDPKFLDYSFINELRASSKKYVKNRVNTTLATVFDDMRKASTEVKLPKNYKPIKNLQDAFTRITTNSKKLHRPAMQAYLSDLLKKYQFMDASKLHRDMEEWTKVLLDADSIKDVNLVIRYIEYTEKLLNKVLTLDSWKANKFTELQDMFKNWYIYMPKIDELITQLKTTLEEDAVKLAKQHDKLKTLSILVGFLDDTKNVISELRNTHLPEDMLNFLDSMNNVYYTQLSHKGMFDIIMQHTNLTTSTKKYGRYSVSQVMQELMNPNSYMRKKVVPELVELYKQAHLDKQARYLEDAMAQIDVTVALQKLLNADLDLDFLTEEQSRYCITLLFDAIRNNPIGIGEVNNRYDIISNFFKDIRYNINKHLDPTKYATPTDNKVKTRKILTKSKKTNKPFNRAVQVQYSFKDNTPLILIKSNASKRDIYRFLHGNDFKSTETLFIGQAYSKLREAGLIPDVFPKLLDDRQYRKMFLHSIGQRIHDHLDIIVPQNPGLTFTQQLELVDWDKVLTESMSDLIRHDSRIDTIVYRLELLFHNYIHDLSNVSLLDFPIYSLYSRDTITQLEILIANYSNIITELTNTPKPVIAEATVLMEYLNVFNEAIQDGIDVVIKGTDRMSDYIDKQKARKYLSEKAHRQNLFHLSVESGIYGAKKVYFEEVDEFFNMTSETINGTNVEKRMLNNRLYYYLKNIELTPDDQALLNNADYVEIMRESLIQTYSRKGILFEMPQAEMYFNSLDAEQLYYWDRLTKSYISKNNRRYYREFINQQCIAKGLDANVVTSELFSNLDRITEGFDKNFIPDNAFAHVVDIMQTMQYGELSAYIDMSFMSMPKSLEELGEYQTQIQEFIDKDIITKDKALKALDELDTSPRLNLTSDDKFDMLTERKATLAHTVSKLNPSDLRNYIDNNTPGALFFYNDELVEVTTKEGEKYWTGIEKPFDFSDDEFAKVGLKKVELENDWIVVYRTDNAIGENKAFYGRPKYIYEDAQMQLTNILEDNVDYLNLEDMDVPLDMTVVEAMPEPLWLAIQQDSAFDEALKESAEHILYQKDPTTYKNTFFKKSYSRLNYTIIGGPNALELMQARYRDAETYIHYSRDIIKHTKSGLLAFLNRSNRIKKYLSLFFNKDFSIGSSLFHPALSNLSDKELAEFLANGEYRALILRADKNGQPIVFDYMVNSQKTLQNAVKDGVILVPKDTATAIKQVVNNRQLDYSLWSLYKRLVVPLYKGLYLMTVGFPFRNLLDSAIYKNATELGLSKAIKNDLTAIKMLRFHNEIQTKALALNNNLTLNKETLFKVLSEYSEEEQRAFFLIDLFVNSSASSGFSDSFKKYLEQYNKVDDVRQAWEIVYNDKIINGDFSPIRLINDLNNTIEQTSRLGLFLGYLDSGLRVPDAIKKVNLTHFNYSDRTPFLEFVENIFWFSTFPINNLHFYMNHGLQNNPMLLRTLVDTQTVSWNNGEYTYEELKKTNFLSYHALAGNIRIGNTILKISPSVFDVIGIMTDPINNITDRLNPFLSMPIDVIEAQANDKLYLDLVPGSTQINNATKVYNTLTGVKEDSLIPSVYTLISNSKYSGPKHYVNKTRGAFTNWTKYPKLKRPRRFYNISSKYYAKQYRWMYNKNIRNYFRYHDDAQYLMQRSGKRKTINQLNGIRYNRAIRFFKTQRRFTKA